MAEKFAVGVDLGGTKILAGVVNISNGQLISAAKKKTRVVEEGGELIKRIASCIAEAIEIAGVEPKKLVGIGVGAAGMVDRERGVLLAAANIGGTNDLPMADPLSAQFGLPVRLGNDVEVATLGELNYGAGRDCDNFVCMFIGTGIGSGIVNNGKIYRGGNGTAGEVGHIVVMPDGLPCGCGGYGCLETYASRTAIAKTVMYDINRGMDTVLRDKIDPAKGILRSKAIAQALDMGDASTLRAITQAAQFLGVGLATVINFYNPRRIILGGGLVEAVPQFFDLAELEARRRALRIPSRKTEIVRAELGDYAGTIGAALLCKN
ncbi:MAG: ROK family protein [Cyanobacteria bacterium SZAS LIN-2]|nr:ROK family protein [Cyanobacteria bacterium SZAS LIN-3]MBS1996179.1 ROK family protein [Cyanobacteria bacterium SZAS LIN-2]MBS2007825.1 ROK family protein [Cyanobacteria bacterium SZAS TMP-1]